MTSPSPHDTRQQSLRLKRLLIASTTYALGFTILALCTAAGLFSTAHLWIVGLIFLAVNVGFFTAIRSGWNLRFEDPALTQAQVCVGVGLVALILVLGEHVHFLAVPYYSSLFVFAMLKLKPRELFDVEVFVLVSYFAAMAVRVQLFGATLDLRVEAINAALVVLSSLWYALAASYISNLRARLRASIETIEQLASRDALTDTWNRRHLDALLSTELQRKARIGGELCVCMVDLDHFKSINDRFGHPVGDTVLKAVAREMQARLRSIDTLGRFGGEEFLILLPGATLADAEACARRLLLSVAKLAPLPDPAGRITVSIGLAQCVSGESVDALLARVDRALYQAKRDGRNRVSVDVAETPA